MANGNCETTVTVKWWAVVVLILGITGALFSFLFNSALGHESRLTKLETQYTQFSQTLGELRDITKEIRQDQITQLKGRK